MVRSWVIFFFVMLCTGCYSGSAENLDSAPATVSAKNKITGKAAKIIDGDTFDLLLADRTIRRIRLFGIDCPERAQAYYQVAKDELGTLLRNASLTIDIRDIDRYGRTVGIVQANQKNVNEAMLSAGFAWHYRRYDNNPEWSLLEKAARRQSLGLWADSHPVAPWVFKSEKRLPVNK